MPLTANVESINTGPTSNDTPARQHAGTPARQHASDADAWVNFSTYLPAPLRRTLKARCAALDIEVRQAVTDAITAWLATHSAEHDEPAK